MRLLRPLFRPRILTPLCHPPKPLLHPPPHHLFTTTPSRPHPKPLPPLPPLPTIPASDLTETFLKGSGPGGQKINKTSSAVQLIHHPTGIVVKCQATRSRSLNRRRALRALQERLEEREHGANSRAARRRERERVRKRRAGKKSRRKYRGLAEQGEEDGEEGEEGEEGLEGEDGEEDDDGGELDVEVLEPQVHEGRGKAGERLVAVVVPQMTTPTPTPEADEQGRRMETPTTATATAATKDLKASVRDALNKRRRKR